MKCGRPSRSLSTEIHGPKEMAMWKVIEFYVPAIFHKPLKGAEEQQCAKVIEFCTQTRKSA
jgi:hypothetical protein